MKSRRRVFAQLNLTRELAVVAESGSTAVELAVAVTCRRLGEMASAVVEHGPAALYVALDADAAFRELNQDFSARPAALSVGP